SLILVVALLAALGTIVYETAFNRPQLSGTIVNAYTLTPLADATIVAGGRSVTSDRDGSFTIPGRVTEITATKVGFEQLRITIASTSGPIQLELRPNVVAGRIVSTATQQPVAGATVKLTSPSGTSANTTTDSAGHFAFNDVPPD